jgi:hypothetical protein
LVSSPDAGLIARVADYRPVQVLLFNHSIGKRLLARSGEVPVSSVD